MQTRRATSLVGFVIGGLSLAGPSLAAQQLPSPTPPTNQQPAPSFTQPPDANVLETLKALKGGMTTESVGRALALLKSTAPSPTPPMIQGPNPVCTMIVVPVDSSIDPEFVREVAADAAPNKMPVVQPACRSTPQRR